jgi:hypothetical protein
MRLRAIQGVPGLDPNASPFQRFEKFARLIAAVPKSEVEKMTKNGAGLKKNGNVKMPIKAKSVMVTESGSLAAHVADENTHGVGVWNLSVLIVPDEELWFAQGLEINYGAQGTSVKDAQLNFQKGLLATIRQHLRVHGNIDGLLKFAPSHVLREANQNKSLLQRFDTVSFHDIADLQVQSQIPFTGIDYRVIQQKAA